MLAVIPDDLRFKLKNQVYYSAEHFLEVFNELKPRLTKLPIPLHPLLEDATIDAAQAMKDMHRERLTLNGPEVAPTDVPRLLSDIIHKLLEERLARADTEARLKGDQAEAQEDRASPERPPPVAGVLAASLLGEPADSGRTSAAPAMDPTRHNRTHASLTEHLVMRTINAASRTTSGGDSFFIVQVSSSSSSSLQCPRSIFVVELPPKPHHLAHV